MNAGTQSISGDGNVRWRSVLFTHPSTLDTITMETDLKNKVKSDLESFLKAKQYYQRLGRVWKQSFLLYETSGTGKSSFVADLVFTMTRDREAETSEDVEERSWWFGRKQVPDVTRSIGGCDNQLRR
ncbi:hypothetical protein K1719_038781 [Acacia pycnantha]|nr:hypothetical protein K1719_038781 [Acacia pycnantha]